MRRKKIISIDKKGKDFSIKIDEKKIKKIIDKHSKKIDAFGIILVIIIITLIIVLAIQILTTKVSYQIPNNKTINETCKKYGMIPDGYRVNLEEKKTYILCKTKYEIINKTNDKD
jgi:hypothetical protein